MWKEGGEIGMVLGERCTCQNITYVDCVFGDYDHELVISKHSIVRYFQRHENKNKEIQKYKKQIDKYTHLKYFYSEKIEILIKKIKEMENIVLYFCGNCKITKNDVTYVFDNYILKTIL